MDSILTSVKKLIGIGEDDTSFDTDIIVFINSTLMFLNQLGVGPLNGFLITGKDDTWSTFLEDRQDIESVKSYVYLKVRLIFDPPTSAYVLESMERQVKEIEWRLSNQ